jgi:trehalose synthase
VFEVRVGRRSTERLRAIAGNDGERYGAIVEAARRALDGRSVWHLNSTPEGGGVAELLRANLPYLSGDGIRARWGVLDGDGRFFLVTKRLHNRLHGVLGDGGPLGEAERAHYDSVIERNAEQAAAVVEPGDVVVVHDPQPLGLVPALREAGATVIWTCHVGVDVPNDITRSAWAFLLPDVRAADASTFTRAAYVWEGLEGAVVRLIPPCIDIASPKNVSISRTRRDAILRAAGVLAPSRPGEVGAQAQMGQDGYPPPGASIVTQVSRWDALKDPVGVVRGFVDEPRLDDAHLILAGPAPSGVADDPEALEVLGEVDDLRTSLPPRKRTRVHLANLPTDDLVENARIVNALQRRADVVVQKSLAEGFGLTVSEAMWKARPVVATDVGGIRDQIEDGVTGRLVAPRDLETFGRAVRGLLDDPHGAERMGEAAQIRVRDRFLGPRHLGQYVDLLDSVLSGRSAARP